MASGTYTLLLALDRPATVEVGALGERRFEPGAYAYTGSAFGSGGLEARIARHRRLVAGEADVRHWHVDYLLGLAGLQDVFTAEGLAAECEVARAIPGDRVPGFGASDCDCDSHLTFAPSASALEEGLAARYGEPSDLETV